jgi:hypothetical protein
MIYGLNLWECLPQDLVEIRDNHRASQFQGFIQWLKLEIPKEHIDETEENAGRESHEPEAFP